MSEHEESTDRAREQTSGEALRHAYHHAYGTTLREAVEALTKAALLPRPRLMLPPPNGAGDRTEEPAQEWVVDDTRPFGQTDWAEFVTLAMAGAAANVGGVETILAGRPVSWEAAGVRWLLEMMAGTGETRLWKHRTEPMSITLYVDELLNQRSQAARHYADSRSELERRAKAALEPLERALRAGYSRHGWGYQQDHCSESCAESTPDGSTAAAGFGMRMIAVDPSSPPWSWEAWRAGMCAVGTPAEKVEDLEERLRTREAPITGGIAETGLAFIPKSRADAADLRRLAIAVERETQKYADLEQRLEAQRRREWTAYGAGLAERIELVARALPDWSVPVEIVVDIETHHHGVARGPVEHWTTLDARLVETAAMDTPSPADYGGSPLDRLLAAEDRDGNTSTEPNT